MRVDEREAKIRAIADEGAKHRKRPSRGLWIAALVVSAICVGGLVYGLVFGWDAQPTPTAHTAGTSNGTGFGLGMMVGIGAGIAIGALLGLRRRSGPEA